MYTSKRSASLMKVFHNFCNLVMTLTETVTLEIIPFSNIGLTHCLQTCKIVCGLEQNCYELMFIYLCYSEKNPHGTNVAGLAAAKANNSFCGVGVAYDSKIAGKSH